MNARKSRAVPSDRSAASFIRGSGQLLNPPDGVGIFTFAITRSTNPNSGANRVSCASSRSSLRSRSAVCRHSAHHARWTSRAAGSRPCAQSSISSGVRWTVSGVGVILAQPYARAGTPVSLFPVLQVTPQFVARPMDIRLDRAERQVQDVGDLFVAVALYVAQQDAGAVLGAQLRDRSLDRAAQLARLGLLERRLAAVAQLQGRGAHLVGRPGVGGAVER